MTTKFLSPEAVENLTKLAASSYRPPEIIKLAEEIEGETRAAGVNFSVTKVIDPERVLKIVGMKRRLDSLLGAWAKGEI